VSTTLKLIEATDKHRIALSGLPLLTGPQEEHPACKNLLFIYLFKFKIE